MDGNGTGRRLNADASPRGRLLARAFAGSGRRERAAGAPHDAGVQYDARVRALLLLLAVTTAACGDAEVSELPPAPDRAERAPRARATVSAATEAAAPVSPLDALHAGRALRVWIVELGDDDPAVRTRAAAALLAAGDAAASAFAEAIRTEEPSFDLDAEPALRDLVLPALLQLLAARGDGGDDPVRERILWHIARAAAIGGHGPHDAAVAASLVELLPQHPLAREAFVGCGTACVVHVPVIARGLADPDARVRRETAELLLALGSRAAAASDALAAAVEDSDAATRQAATRALAEIGPRPQARAVAALAERAARVPDDASSCLWALGCMGDGAAPAVPTALRLAASADAVTRQRAVELLARFRDEDPSVRPALERMRDDPSEEVRDTVREALSHHGIDPWAPRQEDSPPDPVGPARMAELLALPDDDVTWETLREIRRADAACFDRIAAALERRADPRRPALLAALRNCGAAADAHVDLLRRELGSASAKTRAAAAGSLHALRGNADDVLPTLLAIVRDNTGSYDDEVGWALDELARIGAGAAPAVPELRRFLRQRQSCGNLVSACRALGAIGPAAAAAVPELVSAVEGRSGCHYEMCVYPESIRFAAADALGAIGPAAEAAVPALREAILDVLGHEGEVALAGILARGPERGR